MDKKSEIKNILIQYEEGSIRLKIALYKINQILDTKVKEEDLIEYWSYTTLDDLIDGFLIDPVKDWEKIDDSKAIRLLGEVISNLNNDFLL